MTDLAFLLSTAAGLADVGWQLPGLVDEWRQFAAERSRDDAWDRAHGVPIRGPQHRR